MVGIVLTRYSQKRGIRSTALRTWHIEPYTDTRTCSLAGVHMRFQLEVSVVVVDISFRIQQQYHAKRLLGVYSKMSRLRATGLFRFACAALLNLSPFPPYCASLSLHAPNPPPPPGSKPRTRLEAWARNTRQCVVVLACPRGPRSRGRCTRGSNAGCSSGSNPTRGLHMPSE